MMVELSLNNLIVVAITTMSALWALVKVIAVQFERGIKRDLQEQFEAQVVASRTHYEQVFARLEVMESAVKSDAGHWSRIERELLTMKADMPLNYVRREDYIRGQSVLEAKIDGLGSKLESAMLRVFSAPVTNTERGLL